MKRKSIKKLIMTQFIFYTTLMCIGLMVVASLFAFALDTIAFTYDLPVDIDFRDIPNRLQLVTAGVFVGSASLVVLLFLLCTRLFGTGISHQIQHPVDLLVKGLRQITEGDLDTILKFEADAEYREMRDSFNYMAKRLNESERQREALEKNRMQLFSSIAHDLKTPMTIIMGYAGALEKGIVRDEEKQLEYYSAIKEKSTQVNTLIDQLFSYSKLGAEKFRITLANADLAELIRAGCAGLFGEIESKRMQLELDVPNSPVYGTVDFLELNRGISNLLTNAIRHNPAGTLLYVGLKETESAFEIRVADSGPAIPEALAETLFEPFATGSSSRSEGSGTGLGLAIVKKVAEQHGGDLWLDSYIMPYEKAFVIRIPKASGDILRSNENHENAGAFKNVQKN